LQRSHNFHGFYNSNHLKDLVIHILWTLVMSFSDAQAMILTMILTPCLPSLLLSPLPCRPCPLRHCPHHLPHALVICWYPPLWLCGFQCSLACHPPPSMLPLLVDCYLSPIQWTGGFEAIICPSYSADLSNSSSSGLWFMVGFFYMVCGRSVRQIECDTAHGFIVHEVKSATIAKNPLLGQVNTGFQEEMIGVIATTMMFAKCNTTDITFSQV
jgi:hypothetical protein